MELKEYYDVVLAHNHETELRLIDKKGVVESRHVNSYSDFEKVINQNKDKCNIYVGLHEREKGGTTSESVINAKRIIIDIDFKEYPKNQSPLSIAVRWEAKFKELRWDILAKVESGNGLHYYFKVDKSLNLYPYREFLKNNIPESLIFDQNMFDLARIIRVPFTYNLKGNEKKAVELKFLNRNSEILSPIQSESSTPSQNTCKSPSKCPVMEAFVKEPDIKGKKTGQFNKNAAKNAAAYFRELKPLEILHKKFDHSEGEAKGWLKLAIKNDYQFNCLEFNQFVSDNYPHYYNTACIACLNKQKQIEEDMFIDASTLHDLDITPTSFLIDKLIPEKSIIVLAGQSGVGKSMLSLNMSIAVATGTDIFENKSHQSNVIYIDEENRTVRCKERLRKQLRAMDLNPDRVKNRLKFLISKNLKIGSEQQVNNCFSLKDIEEYIKNYKPKLIILDSLIRFFLGDENSSSDTRHIFDALKMFTEKYDISFIVLHHLGKTLNGGKPTLESLRGSGDIGAMADYTYILTKGSELLTLYQVKNRDDNESRPILLKMESSEDSINIKYVGLAEDKDVKKDRLVQDVKTYLYHLNKPLIQKAIISKNFDLTRRQFSDILEVLKTEGIIDEDTNKRQLKINMSLLADELQDFKVEVK